MLTTICRIYGELLSFSISAVSCHEFILEIGSVSSTKLLYCFQGNKDGDVKRLQGMNQVLAEEVTKMKMVRFISKHTNCKPQNCFGRERSKHCWPKAAMALKEYIVIMTKLLVVLLISL